MEQDRRTSTRKVLRTHGILTSGEGPPIKITVLDIAVDSMSITLDRQLKSGARCRIEFSALINGKKRTMIVVGRVVYCICGAQGFRVGVHFVDVEADVLASVSAYVNC